MALAWLKKLIRGKQSVHTEGILASQPPGQIFPWPKGVRLVAIDDITIAIPAAVIHDDEQIGSVIFGDNDMEIKLPLEPTKTTNASIYLRLRTGMSVSLTRSCDAIIIADDSIPRRIRAISPR